MNLKKFFVFIIALILTSEIFCRAATFLIHKDIKAFALDVNLYQPDAFVAFKPAFNFHMKHNAGGYSPATGAFTAPTEVKVNRFGFRGPDFSVKRHQSTQRIFCLGGSETWGYGASDNETWAALLQDRLGSQYEVINAGVPGYTTFHSLANLATRILDFEPDFLIISHSWNDIKYFRSVTPENQYGSMINASDYTPQSTFQKFLNRSYLYIYLKTGLRILNQKIKQPGKRTSFEGPALPRKAPNYDYGLKVFERNLRTILAIAKTYNLKVMIVDPLTLVKAENSKEEKSKIGNELTGLTFEELVKVNQAIDEIDQRLAAEYGSQYVNLNKQVPASIETMIDHIHPTPLGHQKIAEALSKAIIGEPAVS